MAEQFQRIKKERPDGEWTSIVLKMGDNKIQGGFAGVDEPGQYFQLSNFSSFAWSNLVTSGKIYIGKYGDFSEIFENQLYDKAKEQDPAVLPWIAQNFQHVKKFKNFVQKYLKAVTSKNLLQQFS